MRFKEIGEQVKEREYKIPSDLEKEILDGLIISDGYLCNVG